MNSLFSRGRNKKIEPGPLGLFFAFLLYAMGFMLWSGSAQAVTYANVATTFNWIDASTHTKLGPTTGGVYSPLYRFSNTGGCGSTPPYIDDSLSDNIPIGFTFMYGGVSFTQVRIMTNGRLQFNTTTPTTTTTCGYGSPVTQLPYPSAGLNYTMRIYGGDLDPSLQSEIGLAYITSCTTRASCYVSYAVLGTAPYRSFVVTWSNVPEWTTATSASGSYSVQVILQENGEFVYQYGANTPGPGNTVAQIGWQVDSNSNDFEVPAVGFPANNSAIKFYIPRPVAEYRMEQPSWNGTAGEVFDTSGNGRHGTAVAAGAATRPTAVAAGRVCRGGQVADNATAADISAVNTGLSIPTAVGSVGTISFWYNNSSGDRMLFDASVTNNRWFYLRRTSNRALSFVVTDSVNTNRTATTANSAIPDTGWTHIAVTWNFNALAAANSDRVRVYVNGVLSVTSAFSSAGTLSPSIDTLYIGDNRSSVSPVGASAGNPGGANASIDEFRIYNYEGGLALVQRDMNQAGACLHHYAITTSGTPSVCSPPQPVQVTVTAHDSAHGVVTMPNNTTQVVLSISPTATPSTTAAALTNGGNWSLVSGYGTFNDGTADDGLATYIFNGEYQVVLNYQPTVSGNVYAHVTDGQIVESENTVLSVAGCVSNFNGCEPPIPPALQCTPTAPPALGYAALYTKLSGSNFNLEGVALKSDGTREPGFSGSVAVDLLANINTGVSLGANNCPSSQDAVIALGNASFSSGRATVSGVNVTNAYRDVRMRFTCSVAVCGSAITRCSSDNFAIRPQSFTLSTTTALNPVAPSTNKLAAGEDFNLMANPGVTVGYTGTPAVSTANVVDHAATAVNAALTWNNPTLPLPGAAAPNGFPQAAGGSTSNIFQYHDVGTITLRADAVTDAGYTSVDQANNDCVTGSTSNTAASGKFGCTIGSAVLGPLGRFHPHHFAANASFTPGCVGGGFTYMDHDALGITLNITAQSKTDATATRYASPASTYVLPATLGVTLLNDASATDLLSRLSQPSVPARIWTAGAYTAGDTYRFDARNLATPVMDGPYDSLRMRVAVTDATDGVKITKLNGTAVAPAVSSIDSPTTRVRYGRLRMQNAYGSELLPIRVPVRAEYFKGTGWLLNTLDDSCTTIPAAALARGNVLPPASLLAPTATLPVTLSSGQSNIILTQGATKYVGSVDLALNLRSGAGNDQSCVTWGTTPVTTGADLPWLQFPWCGGKLDPAARIRFGSPKAPYIYLRERY
ncbi:MAG: LamG domain-containing protein [Gammaproteobacteria bacterium]|nr:LamG domain-containing protein [Rhodocyclaceae bacterium]MBU3909502.1 LamG domain-containing protein [Gammaproteobacteria bacterium]MBU3987799.1 LamG domain-containing protein [Gammaproteobacteria bacterium]MBU4003165.1 LamG domain-containing protein [Gammaproteobacteria bacterium]MBU4022214.1 LamG domain-containing protein [Gammaproteobacteria bacterium]